MTAPPEPEKVRRIFTAIAGGYDRFNGIASLGLDRRWRRESVRRARLEDGAKVLDLAAGTGDLTIALAEQARPALVVSSDFTQAMLEVGRDKARARGIQHVSFSLADAQRLPFRDACFDALTVAFGLRNFADRPASYREALRVLKPAGRYVVLELTHPGFLPFKPIYWLYVRRVLPILGMRVAGDRAAYEYLHDSIQAFPDAPALAAEMTAAGFARVEWAKLSMGIVAIHVAHKA
jgi:demethylmenaquinone methyltransferase/2-methoxy-6-polyprenyl-1,4-benzoquinol methylase